MKLFKQKADAAAKQMPHAEKPQDAYSNKTRLLKSGAFAGAVCAVGVALAVVLNLFVSALPKKYTNLDMTDTGIFSLSQESKDLLAGLTTDVTLYYLAQNGKEDVAVQQLLSKYEGASSHIKVVQKDPVLYPSFAASFDAKDAAEGSIIVNSAERTRVVEASSLYTQTLNQQTYGYDTAFDGEGALASALQYVMADSAAALYKLSGHGELDLSDAVTRGLARQNTDVQTLSLLTETAVPTGTGVLLIDSPTKDLSADEAKKVEDYLAAGGGVMLVTDYGAYTAEAMPNLTGVLAKFGLSASNGVVVETSTSNYLSGTYPYYLLPTIQSHAITSPLLANSSFVLAPLAHAISIAEALPENVTVSPLLKTSEGAYDKQNVTSGGSVAQSAEDPTGSFCVAAAAENSSTGAKLVWFSTSGLMDAQIDAMVSGSNSDLVLNAVSWMTDNETGITIHAKNISAQKTLTVPAADSALWGNLFTIALPAALLLTGFVVWLMRRKK